jgi:oxygen-independent coproporphyrinogen-3 oxidase
MFERYVDKVCAEIQHADQTANQMGGMFDKVIDSIYLGGGTPTLLRMDDLTRVFAALRNRFMQGPDAEITVECAPGTITAESLETLIRNGVTRVSLGVQSFVDKEVRSVGRLHSQAIALSDIERLRAAGISNINVDLIAGLPYQDDNSWRYSLKEALNTGVPHVSVYMLEIDDDSRLGRELVAGGSHYHAHHVPDDNLIAELYGTACETLPQAGVFQYEISNFARPGNESQHNFKYWTRQPYMGFGVDAHSFLPVVSGDLRPEAELDAVRFSNPDSLDLYLAGKPLNLVPVPVAAAAEECFFLGLRLNRGLELRTVEQTQISGADLKATIADLCEMGLLDYDCHSDVIRLTQRGRLLSNEVFARFIA